MTIMTLAIATGLGFSVPQADAAVCADFGAGDLVSIQRFNPANAYQTPFVPYTVDGTTDFIYAVDFAPNASDVTAADFTVGTLGTVSVGSLTVSSDSGAAVAVTVHDVSGVGSFYLYPVNQVSCWPSPDPIADLSFHVTQANPAPVVTNVTSTLADGTYTTGVTVLVTVSFSEAVKFSTGFNATLDLNVGNNPGIATLVGGPFGAETITDTLTFTYTVVSGDSTMDLQYQDPSALVITAGSALDGVTAESAAMSLPTVSPVAGNSLAGNKNIVISAKAPVITLNGSSSISLIIGNTFTDPGSVVTDDMDMGLVAIVTGMVETNTLGTYTLTYNATDTSGNMAVPVTRTVTIIPQPSSGGGGGSGGGFDPNLAFTPSTQTTSVPVSTTNSNGTATTTTAGSANSQQFCPAIEGYWDVGERGPEVRKIQLFLNVYEGAGLTVDGVYGLETFDAVKAFQIRYTEQILQPWGLGRAESTGFWYKTTSKLANYMVGCDVGSRNLENGVIVSEYPQAPMVYQSVLPKPFNEFIVEKYVEQENITSQSRIQWLIDGDIARPVPGEQQAQRAQMSMMDKTESTPVITDTAVGNIPVGTTVVVPPPTN